MPNRRLSGLWTTALIISLTSLALAGGWWLGRKPLQTGAADDPRKAALVKEVGTLRERLDGEEATPDDRQRLLELLVGLDRKQEAIDLLEPMADREPERWSLRLMLAELRRDQNDLAGAERELRLILNRKADQMEALQLITLIKLEQGRASEAEAQVKAAFDGAAAPTLKPEALGIGLLLGDLRQRRQQPDQAEATYKHLATLFPRDQRPLLALALSRHDRGDVKGALEALAQARLRSDDPSKPDPRLDRIAASWGLKPLRAPSSSGSPPKTEPEKPTGPQNP